MYAHDIKFAAHKYREKLLLSSDEQQAARMEYQNWEFVQNIYKEVW